MTEHVGKDMGEQMVGRRKGLEQEDQGWDSKHGCHGLPESQPSPHLLLIQCLHLQIREVTPTVP